MPLQPELSSGAIEALAQLFIRGPTWDGNVISKAGRDELVRASFAYHREGWAYLSSAGVAFAVNYPDARKRFDQRWYRKQANLPESE